MFNAATLALFVGLASAHLAAWHPAMYCINGNQDSEDLNSYAIVSPLYQLPFNQWWFHNTDNCPRRPPPPGVFLDLPAGGSFRIEIGSNRAKTETAYGGRDTSEWPDGATYPEDYNVPSCIIHPNLHAQNRSMAAGTAMAISYTSDINQVRPDNLVVFTVRHNTPWKRKLWYDVPKNLPACPEGGCICAWGWVPNGCGQPNMYHQPFRCRVTGATSTTPVARPRPPVWCENNPGGCTQGAKQMVYWNQAEGNNIHVDGYDASGGFKSPGYNMKLGFADGAQNNIFDGPPASTGGGAQPPPPQQPPASPGSPPNSNNNNNGNASNGGNNAQSSPSAAAPSASSTPSCQKRNRRRGLVEDSTSLVKKSTLVQGIAAHRRHHARQTV